MSLKQPSSVLETREASFHLSRTLNFIFYPSSTQYTLYELGIVGCSCQGPKWQHTSITSLLLLIHIRKVKVRLRGSLSLVLWDHEQGLTKCERRKTIHQHLRPLLLRGIQTHSIAPVIFFEVQTRTCCSIDVSLYHLDQLCFYTSLSTLSDLSCLSFPHPQAFMTGAW